MQSGRVRGEVIVNSGNPQHSNELPASKVMPKWLIYFDLACASIAFGLWCFLPQVGGWPIVLVLCPWMLRLGLAGRLSNTTPFDLPMVLFLVTAGLGVWAAYGRQVAWSKFWPIVGGMMLFYAIANAWPIPRIRIWFPVLFGAGLALFFLATHHWDAYEEKFRIVTRLGKALQASRPALPGPYLNPNQAGGMLAMMLPFAGLAVIQTWRGTPSKMRLKPLAHWLAAGASLVLLILMFFGLVMTSSRSAWLALGGALLLASLWVAAGRLSRQRVERRTWIFLGLLVLPLVAVLGTEFFWPGGTLAASTFIPGPETWPSRVEFHRNSLMLVKDYPFIGAGLGGFEMLYSTYVMLSHVGFISHAHNLYLSVAIHQGLFALVALIWMWLLFASQVWRTALRSQSRFARAFPAAEGLGAAALSLVVMLIYGMAESSAYSREGIMMLFVPLAFASPFIRKESHRSEGWLPLVLFVGAGLVVGMGLLWWRPLLSTFYSNLGAVHQSQAELSVYAWPEWPIQDAVRQAADLRRPVAEFERALALDPENATANRRLGMIELSLGKYEEALDHLEAAYAAEADSVTTQQLLGEALIVNGRQDEGQALWADVSNEQMQLEQRVSWYQRIGDTERATWVRQAVDSR